MSPSLSIKEHPLYIDASMIKCFSDCREQFRRRYIENIVPSKPSIAYVFGTAVHMAVEAFWNGKDYKQACSIGFNYLDSLYESWVLVKDQGKMNELINALPKMLEVYYNENDQSERYNIRTLEGEFNSNYFQLHTDLGDVHICGRIDRYMKDYKLYDLKTASEIGKDWKKNYKAEKLRDCGLALYDWFLSTELSQPPKEIAMEVLIKPYKDKPPRLELIELNEIIGQRDRFKKQLKAYVTDIVHYMRKNSEVEPWEMNFGSICMTKYGECDYLKLCNYGNIPKYLSTYKPREEHLEIRKSNINA